MRNIEQPCDEDLQALYCLGISMELSPTILTKEEANRFLPIYLDRTSHSVIIEDRGDFVRNVLQKVKEQMVRWGSRRTETGGYWHWEIRPNLKWNELIHYDE